MLSRQHQEELQRYYKEQKRLESRINTSGGLVGGGVLFVIIAIPLYLAVYLSFIIALSLGLSLMVLPIVYVGLVRPKLARARLDYRSILRQYPVLGKIKWREAGIDVKTEERYLRMEIPTKSASRQPVEIVYSSIAATTKPVAAPKIPVPAKKGLESQASNKISAVEQSNQKDSEEIYKALLGEARNDPNIVGFFLGGSLGKGVFSEHSDWDVCFVVRDGTIDEYKAKYPRYKYPGMELMTQTVSQFRDEAAWGSPDAWGRYDYAWITAAVDKTGEIQRILDEKGRIPPEHVKGFVERQLDTYINQFYRSLKCFRDEHGLGARLEANVGIECLFNVLFALHDRRLKPFYKYLKWELKNHPLEKVPYTADELMNKIKRILDDANVETQRDVFLMVEKLCRDEGYGYYIDQWDGAPGQPDFVFMRTFKQP